MGHNHPHKTPIPTQIVIKILSLLPNFDKRRARRVCNRWMLGISRKFEQMRQLMWPMDAEHNSVQFNKRTSSQHRVDNAEEATSTPYSNLAYLANQSRRNGHRSRFFAPSQLPDLPLYLRPPNWTDGRKSQAGLRDLSEISRRIARCRQRSNSVSTSRFDRNGRPCCSYDSFSSVTQYSTNHSNQSPNPSDPGFGQAQVYAGYSRRTQSSPQTRCDSCSSISVHHNYVSLPKENQRDRKIRYSPSDQTLQGSPLASIVGAPAPNLSIQNPYHSLSAQQNRTKPQPDSFRPPGELPSNSPISDGQYQNSAAEILDTLATGLEHTSPNQYAQDPYELNSKQAQPKSNSEIDTIRNSESESSHSIHEYFHSLNSRSQDNLRNNIWEINKNKNNRQPAKYHSQSHLDRFVSPGEVRNFHRQEFKPPEQKTSKADHDYEYLSRMKVNMNKKIEALAKAHLHRSNPEERPFSPYKSNQRSIKHEVQRFQRKNDWSSVQKGHQQIEYREDDGSQGFSRQQHQPQQPATGSKRKHYGGVAHHLHFHKRQPGFNHEDIEKIFERNDEPPPPPVKTKSSHDNHRIPFSQQIKYHHLKARKDEYSRIGRRSKKIVVTKRKAKKNG